jgi:phosphoadenosine phosphosulfate reductase
MITMSSSIDLTNDLADAVSDTESGYASATGSEDSLPDMLFTKPHLKYLNQQLRNLEPQGEPPRTAQQALANRITSEILKWAVLSLPNLYQTTAFGLTGLVTIDMLSKIAPDQEVPLIFLDTLHHFPETLQLVDRVREHYPRVRLHVYKPQGVSNAAEFATRYGSELWTRDEERYDALAKVEPASRAYTDLQVRAVLTGRRRSQGGARGSLDVLEADDEAGVVKVNPLANWTFAQVKAYVDEHGVPYNALLDRGYKSVGDWHSTQPVAEGEDERAGRWKGREKTECGIHNKKSRYAMFLLEQEQKRKQQEEELQRGGAVMPVEVAAV